jgi:hypothetical protein
LYIRITWSAVDGVVPLSQLRLGTPTARLTDGDIVADAQRADLTEPRFPTGVLTALVWTALVPIGLAAIAVVLGNWEGGVDIILGAGGTAVLVQLFVSLVLPWLLDGENFRPAGRAAAWRWLGYRRYLEDAPADRHDPYRVALGISRAAAVDGSARPPLVELQRAVASGPGAAAADLPVRAARRRPGDGDGRDPDRRALEDLERG